MKNLLFILIDDLGWRDLTCYESTFYETPVLDQLARRGCQLTNAYAASPVCSPTRASLLTGKYPSRVGITQYIGGHTVGALEDVPYFSGLPRHEYSLPQALKDDGFQTWHVGKWHLGDGVCLPPEHGFDVNIGGGHWGHPKNGYFSPYKMPQIEDGPNGEYLTDRLTDEAIQLLKNRNLDQPFFLNLWHYTVHTPLQAPPDLVRKYERKAKDMGLDDAKALEPGEGLNFLDGLDRHVVRRRFQSHATYAAMIENLDTNIGRVLQTLEEEGLTSETLVVVSSDNGGLSTAEGSPTCNAPLREGKGWAEEGGLRVPTIFSCPGRLPEGVKIDEPVSSPDFYPTFLEALNLKQLPKQHVDGVSFWNVLQGGKMNSRSLYWHYPHYSNQGGLPTGAVRKGPYKLIEFFESKNCELYHLENDISELNNLAEVKPHIAAELHEDLNRWRQSHRALMPRKNSHWEEQKKARLSQIFSSF